MIKPIYSPAADRYDGTMKYRRCGRSGVLLPEISLGLWHNFGDVNPFANSQEMAHFAFDKGITHFDLANNYGPSHPTATSFSSPPKPATTCGPAPTATGARANI